MCKYSRIMVRTADFKIFCYIVVFTKKFPEVFEPKPSNLMLGRSILI